VRKEKKKKEEEEEEEKERKKTGQNIMVSPIPKGDHNNCVRTVSMRRGLTDRIDINCTL